MEQANLALLRESMQQFGIDASQAAVDAIVRHLELVTEWNQQVNLTALKEERDFVLKHAVDSATALSVLMLPPGARVIDVGTGAGFPGVTMKCLMPTLQLVLLESLAKRCKFLEAVGNEITPMLGVAAKGYQVVWGRAEDKGQDGAFREQFDVALARAVAELRILSEFCLPFVRVGGEFLAMKGPAAQEELANADKAIQALGGNVTEVKEIELPGNAGARTLIRIKKVRSTPKAYPRKAGTPAKNPL